MRSLPRRISRFKPGWPRSCAPVPARAGWQRAHLPELPRSWRDLTVSPDWVCEILSPSTMRLDRVEKMPVYAEEDVRNLWLIDPLAKTLDVFELADGRWDMAEAHGGDGAVSAPPFEAIPLTLADLWLPAPEDEDADTATPR